MNQLAILAPLLAMQIRGIAAACKTTVGKDCVAPTPGSNREKEPNADWPCFQTQGVAGVEFTSRLTCTGRSSTGIGIKAMVVDYCKCVQRNDKIKRVVGNEVKEVSCSESSKDAEFLPTTYVKTSQGKYLRCKSFEGVVEEPTSPPELLKKA